MTFNPGSRISGTGTDGIHVSCKADENDDGHSPHKLPRRSIISHKHQEKESTTSLSEHLMLFIHLGHFFPP